MGETNKSESRAEMGSGDARTTNTVRRHSEGSHKRSESSTDSVFRPDKPSSVLRPDKPDSGPRLELVGRDRTEPVARHDSHLQRTDSRPDVRPDHKSDKHDMHKQAKRRWSTESGDSQKPVSSSKPPKVSRRVSAFEAEGMPFSYCMFAKVLEHRLSDSTLS